MKHKILSTLILTSLLSTSSIASTVVALNVNRQNEVKREGENTELPVLFKFYFYSETMDYATINTMWFWGSDSPGYKCDQFFTGNVVSFPEIEGMQFAEAIIYDGMKVTCNDEWAGNGNDVEVTISAKNFNEGLIIRNAAGNYQTGDLSINLGMLKADKSIFYIDKGAGVSGNIYYGTDTVPDLKINDPVLAVNSLNRPVLEFSCKKIDFDVSALELRKYRYDGDNKYYSFIDLPLLGSNIRQIERKKYRIDIINKKVIDPSWKYELVFTSHKGESLYDIGVQLYYSSDLFEDNFTPDMDYKLGSFIRSNVDTGEEETVFRAWSPSSNRMDMRLYAPGDNRGVTKKMVRKDKGCFELVLPGNLGGYYYTYTPYNYDSAKTAVPDPYAESGNTNSKRSMVVDWNSKYVDPTYNNEGDKDNYGSYISANFGKWDDVKVSDVPSQKAAVSELHVRDFSSDPSFIAAGGNPNYVGKYRALTQKGLTLDKDGKTKIGYDYVKSLADSGLTHVQLLPIYDFASVDESKLDDEEYINASSKGIFNWGYDPQSYNSPEGSYSTNPDDGYERIRELRSVVQAFASADIGVVMDVVYNHMPGKSASSFQKMVPEYYFLKGDPSGAGATMISTRKMYRKYMVDTMANWAYRYKLSGFRYDLMGILDANTIMQCADAVRKINPKALVYGEGWQMFNADGSQGPTEMMASQKNLKYFGDPEYTESGLREETMYVGAFNDNYRDSINGGTGNATNDGFIQRAYKSANTGDTTERNKMYYGLLGTNPFGYGIANSNQANWMFDCYTYNPYFTGAGVNYTECHDNLTAFDKLYMTTKNADVAKTLSNLGNSITAMGVGVTFYQFGQEFGRSKEITDEAYLEDKVVIGSAYKSTFGTETKYFSHNSYNSGDKINSIKWNMVKDNSWMVDNFKSMLTARRDLFPDVRTFDEMESKLLKSCNYKLDAKTKANIVALAFENNGKTYYYICNPQNKAITINNVLGGGTLITGDSNTVVTASSITVQPTTWAIVGK